MRNTNGPTACIKGTYSEPVDAPKILNPLTPTEQEFISCIKFLGIDELIFSLKMTHNLALYHTDLSIDQEEKNALFNLKVLWEELEKL
ncbi:hypothetical protein GCM10009122_38060 [Fulvivirga kasyanovii]|uniref:Uncharacterized protein n=1 Tax=Fulvivirga kasyanovii TaxID=396812 RepID=A0ABW9RP78_9BACT|nr:hypothetical protein [Fulvivirga kasyanovii]MTI25720.1 hypothetical protein [Fulvivirga kasyanovii]